MGRGKRQCPGSQLRGTVAALAPDVDKNINCLAPVLRARDLRADDRLKLGSHHRRIIGPVADRHSGVEPRQPDVAIEADVLVHVPGQLRVRIVTKGTTTSSKVAPPWLTTSSPFGANAVRPAASNAQKSSGSTPSLPQRTVPG